LETNEETKHLLHSGFQAARVLADDAIMGFLAEIRQDLQSELIHTDALDAARREAIYFQLRGLVELEQKMVSLRDEFNLLLQQGYLNTEDD
jgi:hypothetical protein